MNNPLFWIGLFFLIFPIFDLIKKNTNKHGEHEDNAKKNIDTWDIGDPFFKPKQKWKEETPAYLKEAPKPLETAKNKVKQKPEKIWSLELLKSLEWKRFEEVCNEYLIMKGHNAELSCNGADGGIDIKITDQAGNLKSIGQCKAWKKQVPAKEIREFFGTMSSEKVNKGVFFTTSSFSQEATNFSLDKDITLIDGYGLIKRIKELRADNQEQLLSFATAGDYTTPTCARCNTKMIKRTAKESGNEFWGCQNYPRCKNIINVAKA